MAYTLGGLTLPKPRKLTRFQLEKSVEHLLMFGKTTKKVENRKERFVLEWLYLSQAQINSILSLYELETVLSFQCDDTNMPIGPTDVLLDVSGLTFPPSGEHWRENMKLVLTEVH